MKKAKLTIVEDMALNRLRDLAGSETPSQSYAAWIKILRGYLRMTRIELADRAGVSPTHLAGIESGKFDPRVGTLQKIFKAMSCELTISPLPMKPLEEVLRVRAKSIALSRLKQTMGTMALENQAPDRDVFLRLLEKQTDQILNDPRESLWREKDE